MTKTVFLREQDMFSRKKRWFVSLSTRPVPRVIMNSKKMQSFTTYSAAYTKAFDT